jgi:hypothetical protein
MMRHSTRLELFGQACKQCHDDRTKSGVKGLFIGCSKCNAPLAGKQFTAFPADIPGFYELLCVACSIERESIETARGNTVVHVKGPVE